jgi:predicted GIY-YIG superfamily endonuclease
MADYSATIIYTIRCKNPSITELYVGHTTDFVKRRYAHRQASLTYGNKLYEMIRNNGGWENWKMEIVHYFSCNNANEAREKEQEYYVALGATLNSVEPQRDKTVQTKPIKNIIQPAVQQTKPQIVFVTKTGMKYTIYSIVCKDGATNYTYVDYTRNFSTIKYHHKQNLLHNIGVLYDNIREFGGWSNWDMNKLEMCDDISVAKTIVQRYKSGLSNTNNDIKSTVVYNCDVCEFECCKKSDFERHTSSIKHKRLTSTTPENNELSEISTFMKEIFKSNQELIKSNQKLQQQVIEFLLSNPSNR